MEFNGVRPARNIQFGLASGLRLGRHELNLRPDSCKQPLTQNNSIWLICLIMYIFTTLEFPTDNFDFHLQTNGNNII